MSENVSAILTRLVPQITPSSIEKRAAELWHQSGEPEGKDKFFWYLAEKQLKASLVKSLVAQISSEIQLSLMSVSSVSEEFVKNTIETLQKRFIEKVYPEGTKYYNCCGNENNSDQQYILVEKPPEVRTVEIDTRYSSNRICAAHGSGDGAYYGKGVIEKFTLAFPYLLYYIIFKRYNEDTDGVTLRLYFRQKSLTTLKNEIGYRPLLPNIDESGQVCLGSFYVPASASLADKVDLTIQRFWLTTFSYALGSTNVLPDDLTTYRDWAAKTEQNPLFILNTQFKQKISLDLISKYPADNLFGIGELKRKYLIDARAAINQIIC